jgi:hypothetical protein
MGQTLSRFLLRALLLGLAAAGVAADAGAEGAEALERSQPASRAAWKQSGFEYGLHLGVLSVFNGAPLAYGPVDLGWRFANGARVRAGLALFYYRGLDRDPVKPELGREYYYYEMQDLRVSAEYVVPLPFVVRPVAGLALDFIAGSRRRSVQGAGNVSSLAAWSMVAPGALLGLDWRVSQGLSTDLVLRYSNGFTPESPVVATDWSWRFLF